jgi:ABC-type multidrug transport system ATPase subunit
MEIKNFKRFDHVTLELNKNVVLIGPNNSGKSTALQALALWEIGLRKWLSKKKGNKPDQERPGVAINRNDLVALPVPNAKLHWRHLHVRESKKENGESGTSNVRIQIVVDGVTQGQTWSCGLEFDYANEEAFHCRPLRLREDKGSGRMEVPRIAEDTRISFLPPMSGLASIEPKLEPGRINVLLGEGQTAQVLRNLCYLLYSNSGQDKKWDDLTRRIQDLFGVKLLPPEYVVQRGEIIMEYSEYDSILDLSSAGRGLQQTVLLLAYLYANPNSVLLLDEPDAHLEILRQKQIYDILTDSARQQNSQIIAASHSEVILNEATGRDTVIAFIGKPHVIDSQNSQLIKSLTQIGFEDYYKAETKGWVLYVEGPSNLAMLRSWAKKLGHKSAWLLEDVFVVYVTTNLPSKARDHFYGIREAKNDLVGIAIFDRLDKELQSVALMETMWRKREIENYLCFPETFFAFAAHDLPDDLFGRAEVDKRKKLMNEILNEVETALNVLGKNPWSADTKVSDEFLDPVFRKYFEKLGIPNLMRKNSYHLLAEYVPTEKIDMEIGEKLDMIAAVAAKSRPRT